MKTIKYESITIAVIDGETKLDSTSQLLDIFASVSYEEKADNIGLVVQKGSLPDKFFDLKNGFAGEILQKFSNYKVKLAIAGNFSTIKSKAFADFIKECNRGNLVFFVGSTNEALAKLQK